MAKLYFRYGAMNSGKSTAMLQAASVIEPANDPTAAFPGAAPTRGRSVAAAITTAANAGNFIRSTLNIEQPS